ncbi:MAG: penicillin acylase family protein, partial [Planctomycetota bacterium]
SDTDAGAFYGLGYATADERGFQMHYSLRIIQGRLTELVGDVKKTRRNDTALQNDRKMRTFGFARAAGKVAANLDAETRSLLAAYCEGVNDWFAANKDKRHPLFARLGLEPEPWTPADCLLSWWHLGQFFATDGTRDLMSWRNLTGQGPPNRRGMRLKPGPLWRDEDSAVVQRADVPDEWVRRVEAFVEKHRLKGKPAVRAEGPKYSHAWVVGGAKTTTGSAVLVSDPQTPVRNPSLMHEFHISGKTFNARGIGVPGHPGLLIGWNENVAWGCTALGADQADLFRLKTDPGRPDEYFFDGKWRKMTVRRETIAVKGGRKATLTVRETHFGPVVTRFAYARRGDPQVALRRVPVCELDRETIQGQIKMLRAADAREFLKALSDWRFPTANFVFGDKAGAIGYTAVGALPIRSAFDEHRGRAAHDGTDPKYEWRGFIPADLLPHVIDPAAGWIASGNHRPVQSFYKIPIGISTGSMGHSLRSWRLYERLGALEKFKPEDVLAVHYDAVNPARRDIVMLGYHLRDVLKADLSDDAKAALKRLQGWYKAGASSDLTKPGADVAGGINVFFRIMATDLARTYGGGNSGLCRFLIHARKRIAADPKATLSAEEQRFVDRALAGAWRSARGRGGAGRGRGRAERTRRPAARGRQGARRPTRPRVTQRRLGYYESLDGF